MEDNELKLISEKLSLIIRLMLSKDERYQKMTAAEKISLVDYQQFTSEQLSSLLDIPVKTIRNTLPKLGR